MQGTLFRWLHSRDFHFQQLRFSTRTVCGQKLCLSLVPLQYRDSIPETDLSGVLLTVPLQQSALVSGAAEMGSASQSSSVELSDDSHVWFLLNVPSILHKVSA